MWLTLGAWTPKILMKYFKKHFLESLRIFRASWETFLTRDKIVAISTPPSIDKANADFTFGIKIPPKLLSILIALIIYIHYLFRTDVPVPLDIGREHGSPELGQHKVVACVFPMWQKCPGNCSLILITKFKLKLT